MKLEQIDYAGWKNCLRLTNGQIELVATRDVGPRIIRFGRKSGKNLFKEFAHQCGKTGGDEWLSYGGHRLWHAPEVMPRTYYPDNQPVQYAWDGISLLLTPPEEISNRLQLQISITMRPDQPSVTINHRITNTGVWPVELAPWCLSVMAAGGRAVIPQERFIPHGESFSPARSIVLWHFAKMNDPRLVWGEKYIQIREDDSVKQKCKIGVMNTRGWAAYLLHGDLFIKHFPYIQGSTYPDMGCNCEFYTEPGMLEIESLGSLVRLEPGSTVEHKERWDIANADVGENEDDLDRFLLPIVERNKS
jgi:hypothetical protein